jgi:hypothetical protein
VHLVHEAEPDVQLKLYEAELLELPRQAEVALRGGQNASRGGGALAQEVVCGDELLLQCVEHDARFALAQGQLDAACTRVTIVWDLGCGQRT